MEKLSERLMEVTGDGVLRATFDDDILLFANRGYLSILGLDCTPEEAIGRPLRELFVCTEDDAAFRKALAEKGEVRNFTCHFKTLKGEDKWIVHEALITQDPATGRRIVESIVKDVTERVHAEEALAREHNLLRTLIDNLPDSVYFKDAESRFIVANEAVARLMGAPSREALLGKTDFDFYPRELAERYYGDERAVITSGQPLISREEPCIDPEGNQHWFSTTKVPIRSKRGETVGVVGIGRDITRHRQVEEALLEALQRFEAVVANTPLVAIQGFDQHGYIRHWNSASTSIYGFKPEEALGRRLQDLVRTQEEAKRFEQVLAKIWAAGVATTPEEWRARTRDGKEGWVYSSIFPVFEHGKVTEAFCMDVDITDRKLAEEALRVDEMRLETLLKLDQMADVSLQELTDFALEEAIRLAGSTIGYLAYLNEDETVLTMYSWSRIAMAECRISDKPLVYPVATTGLWGEAVRQRKPVITNDYSAPNPLKKGYPEGHVEIRRHMNVPIFDGDRIVIVAGVGNKPTDYDESDVRQVTLLMTGMWRLVQRNRVADALRESEDRYHTLFEIFPMGLFLQTTDARILECNEHACEIFGYSKEELLTLGVTDLVPEDVVELVRRAVTEGSTSEGAPVESKGRRKNGEAFPIEVSTQLVTIAGDRLILARVRDITQQKRAEEERNRLETRIQQSQKLESLGVLAGGIAHDFNNLLTGVLGHASLSLMELSPASPARDNLKQIEIAAQRAAELTKQMLAYSGKGRFMVQAVQISDVVEEMAHLIEVSISKKCVLKYNFAKGLPPIEADVTELRQVIMNLISNASEAIGEKSGVIVVSTGMMHYDGTYLKDTYLNDGLPEGPYVYLEVADTGCGMTPEVRERLFDPFFTTKFTGRGLGLAALLGIVRGHGGAVKVYSEPGRGSTFKVLFPAARGLATSAQEAAPRSKASRGTGTVLVVDDEEVVRELAREVLQDAGFTVVLARDGREALEVFGAHSDEILAVVLDLTMPHVDGVEAFAEIRRIRSDVPVILSSGYNEQDATERFAGKGLAGFIHKPYCAEDLAQIVCKVACEGQRG
jgi:PAS domain S-box-containing protein